MDKKDKVEIVVPENAQTSDAINQYTVLPVAEFDCVLWDNKNLPLDVVAARAYTALKVGGIFIVPKCADVDNLLPVILTMFEIKETDKTHVTFVKEK